jgi:phospholipase/carboxylesterase
MLFHGAGDSADGMMGLAKEWALKMPRVCFVMPTAPTRGPMPCWFGRVKDKLECKDYETVTRELLALLDAERSRLGLAMDRVAIWGYSAGALMAGWLTLQLEEHCAALVLLHGLAPDKRLPPPPRAPLGPRPPALCLAGEKDTQIPPAALEKAVRDLQRHGFQDVVYNLEPEGRHTISDNEMKLMGDFLKKHLQPTKTSKKASP